MTVAGGSGSRDDNDFGIRISSRRTVRTGRYATIGADPAHARRVWFALHGYGQLAARFLRPFAGIVPADTCVVAPEGLSRFYHEMPRADGAHLQRVGATWTTRDGRELDIPDTQAWLDGVYDEVMAPGIAAGAPAACGVLGFSQGMATAMRWVADGAVRPDCFVGWAGGLAADVQQERFAAGVAEARVVLVAGESDSFATATARASVLKGMRRLHRDTREIVFAGGHHLDPGVLTMLLEELPLND
ncbi:MAG: hypothetical protein V4617_13120 [Gemmatimonadota bacterium]